MVKRIVAALAILLLGTISFAQRIELNAGLNQAVKNMERSLSGNGRIKIAVVNMEADTGEMSNYIWEEFAKTLTNSGTFTVVERRDLDEVFLEMEFQLSGMVSDESAQAVGKVLGAEAIVTGSFMAEGADTYRLRIKTINVETAEVLSLFSIQIARSDQTDALLGQKTRLAEAISTTGKVITKAGDFSGRLLSAVVNPIFGVGSLIQGDLFGAVSICLLEIATFGGASAIQNEAVKSVSAILFLGVLVYGVARPFIYQKPATARAMTSKDGLDIAIMPTNAIQLSYTVTLP